MTSSIVLGIINHYAGTIMYLLALVLVYLIVSGGKWFHKEILPRVERWIDAHTTVAEREAWKADEEGLLAAGRAAYLYAEQVYNSQGGAAKLQQALRFFQSNMSNWGLSGFTADLARWAIEKAWKDENPNKAPKAQDPPTVSGA